MQECHAASPRLFCDDVNSASKEEKTLFLFFEPLLARFLPAKGVGHILLWTSLPAFLTLLTLGIGFLNPCAFTRYLPFISLATFIVTLRFRTVGLSASYISLALLLTLYILQNPFETSLWQMGLFFTLAITIYILLLATEEAEGFLLKGGAKEQELLNQFQEAQSQLFVLRKEGEAHEHELKETIEQLKEEIELRIMEQSRLAKRYALIDSEMALLTSQKESFIEEGRSGRAAAAEANSRLESEKRALEERCHNLKESSLVVEEKYRSLEKQLLEAEESFAAQIAELERERSELLAKEELVKSVDTTPILTEGLALPTEPEREENLAPLIQAPVEVVRSEPDPQILQLKRALSQAEGLYGQLRSQFTQKSQILNETRKELFKTQEKLIAMEREWSLIEIEPSEEGVAQEEKLALLVEEVENLEKEITYLEGLISHILAQ